METVLKGLGRRIAIRHGQPTVMIGERINPTGKRSMTTALMVGDFDPIKVEALNQVATGAQVLDINVGAVGADEVQLLPRAVELVLQMVPVPVCIDTGNAEAMRAALAIHKQLNPQGRALVNSVNGQETSLRQILPLVAEYDAAVIALCMDDSGISPSAQQRLAVARKILQRAEELGIPRQHVIVDGLALTMAADHRAGLTALETVCLLKQELGVNLALGGSNVSYGLPARKTINGAFIAMAIYAGVNCLIIDVAQVGAFVRAADLALGRDRNAAAYVRHYGRRTPLFE